MLILMSKYFTNSTRFVNRRCGEKKIKLSNGRYLAPQRLTPIYLHNKIIISKEQSPEKTALEFRLIPIRRIERQRQT